MRLRVVLICCLWALAATGQQQEDDWIDPYDMLNYDATSKSMRKPAESSNYPNVPTKRRGNTAETSEPSECSRHVQFLQNQNQDQQKQITTLTQQPTCNPVFKRFLSRVVKEVERVGLPFDSADAVYDAQIKVSKQTLAEIKSLLDGEDSWRTGALDNAISQILTDLRPHNYEAWKWRFEDTFGVDLETLWKSIMCVLVIVAIISTQLWSAVSWFVQFKRLFAVCFVISIVWNWFYLYKIAFAEHQSNLVKMDNVNQKCTGVRKIDWSDSLKEWFRSTWTLQDDPCKQYYEVLMVNPILLVPPTKAISVTITTFITEPLKHFGQGISEFLRALLKDLPVQLQIPVLLTIVLSILVIMYAGVNAIFQHGITAPFRHQRRDPPGRLEPPAERHLPPIDGDAPFYAAPPLRETPQGYGDGGGDGGGDRGGNQLRQRPFKGQERRQKITVQNVGNLDHSRDEMDTDAHDAPSESQLQSNQSRAESEPEGNVSLEPAAMNKPQAKAKETLNKKPPGDSGDVAEARAEVKVPSKHDPPQMKGEQKQDTSEKDNSPKVHLIESIGHPVQETAPEAAP